jgi:hypothetical protein
MSWTQPRTWVVSETVTASIMNTHVRDNFRDLWHIRQQGATSSATSNLSTIVDTGAQTYPGYPLRIEIVATLNSDSGEEGFVYLTDGAGASLGQLIYLRSDTGDTNQVLMRALGQIQLTPTAASHQYILKWGRTGGTTGIAAGVYTVWERGG